MKQLLRHWTAGGLAGGRPGTPERTEWLRENEPARILERLESLAAQV